MTENRSELYPQLERNLHSAIKSLKESEEICKENRQALIDFLTKLEADGTSSAQRLSYISRIRPIAKLMGNMTFKSVTKKQMEGIIAKYRTIRKLKQNSMNKTVECLKAFYRWLFDLTSADPCPESVRWLKRESEVNNIRPEDLWTEEDVTKLINATRSLRTKAMISLAYESGMRPGELRALKIRDIVFNGDMVRVYCRGKLERKMGERCIPVLRCYNIIKLYIESHPRRNEPEAWLWSYGKKPIIEHYFREQLKNLAKKVGLKKPAKPLILRHSALTRLYGNLPGETARVLAGHEDSRRARTYCHLSKEQLENAVRELNGFEKKEEQETKPICKKCGAVLDLGSSICGHCGLPQDSKTALEKMEEEETLRKIGKASLERVERDPKFLDTLLEEGN